MTILKQIWRATSVFVFYEEGTNILLDRFQNPPAIDFLHDLANGSSTRDFWIIKYVHRSQMRDFGRNPSRLNM